MAGRSTGTRRSAGTQRLRRKNGPHSREGSGDHSAREVSDISVGAQFNNNIVVFDEVAIDHNAATRYVSRTSERCVSRILTCPDRQCSRLQAINRRAEGMR